MENSTTNVERPEFVELPPVEKLKVVPDGDKTAVEASYTSPEGRLLTIRFVLNSDQVKQLSQHFTASI